MFCSHGLIFGGTEGVGSHFHVLRSRTRFRRYRGRQVLFSCFSLPDSFSPGTEGVRSRFDVLPARTHFRRYRGRRIPFSCFAHTNSFSAVPRASGPIFMFDVPRLVFGDTECVGTRFHVLRSLTHFWRYRGRRVPFSSFVCPDSFSAVPRASGPVFMPCAP
jgi:hypothetical protein